MTGRIVTITGPSGTGKSTLAKAALEHFPQASLVTSFTTRASRETDLPGEYRYFTNEQADTTFPHIPMLWVKTHDGNRYATPAELVRKVLTTEGALGIMILVPNVLYNLRQCIRECVGQEPDQALDAHLPIFLSPPADLDTLRARVRRRGDSEVAIERRIVAEWRWESWSHQSLISFAYLEDQPLPLFIEHGLEVMEPD